MIIVLHPANAREECIGEGRLVTDSHHNVKHWRTRSRRYERRERVDARPQQGSRSGNSVSPVGSAEVCKPDTGRCGGCGSCAAPGGGSLKHSAGGLGSRPGGTGLSPRRAEHPDRPDGGPALRSAEVALGRLAADGALEPEVTLVGWRTALTDDAFPLPLSAGSVSVRSRSGLPWKGESGFDHSWTRSTEPIVLDGSSARSRWMLSAGCCISGLAS